MGTLIDLTKSEYEVMDIIWSSDGDLMLSEIQPLLEEKYHRGWKRTTLSTYLSRLVDKSVINTYRKGRYFYYIAEVPKEAYKITETTNFMNFWYKNSLSGLLSALCNDTELSEKEIHALESVIYELDD